MSSNISRRGFLKILGWSGVGAAVAGCDAPTTVTLEEGEETVTSYLSPEEYVIPGIGVWYASTCLQCPAGCGVHGRVREGRILKLEGNPDSNISYGKLCQMGQAGLQAHYNPDRLTKPQLRKGGSLVEVTWDEAWQALEETVGLNSGLTGDRFAWMTGETSGHQSVLLSSFMDSVGAGPSQHFVHEVINNVIGQSVNQDVFSDNSPNYRFDKARMILSFGADFLGTWQSPVHFATEYAKFRDAPRGMLVQVEPKMTLTGANADLWLPCKPGTEGVLALGVANVLINEMGVDSSHIPTPVKNAIAAYDLASASQITAMTADRIRKIATLLKENSPSLVLAGASAEGHAHGYESVAAIMLLNVLLKNTGETLVAGSAFPFHQMRAKAGGTGDLVEFAQAARAKQFDVVFISGTNPVYTAPDHLKLEQGLKNIPFKVAFSQFPDETAMAADLVIPIASAIEDWGSHVASYQPEETSTTIAVQQPLMESLYPGVKGIGDVLLSLLKMRDAAGDYQQFDDYYAYLANAFAAFPSSVKNNADDKSFWQKALQTGVVKVDFTRRSLRSRPVVMNLPHQKESTDYPYHLVPSARLGLWDGRHANLPWLQEAPDQISKVVWDSWAEIHPTLATKLGVKTGDAISISSDQGSLDVKVYTHKGVHPDVIAVPMGQGHQEYGRYAKGRGVNPLKILNPIFDAKTGEMALFATRVTAVATKAKDILVRMGGSESQVGRKIVGTITADTFRRTEGGGTDVA